ncbi:hypothetical protein ACFL6E_05100 [Candidatus Neomarinimicrobiota bacterium]
MMLDITFALIIGLMVYSLISLLLAMLQLLIKSLAILIVHEATGLPLELLAGAAVIFLGISELRMLNERLD